MSIYLYTSLTWEHREEPTLLAHWSANAIRNEFEAGAACCINALLHYSTVGAGFWMAICPVGRQANCRNRGTGVGQQCRPSSQTGHTTPRARCAGIGNAVTERVGESLICIFLPSHVGCFIDSQPYTDGKEGRRQGRIHSKAFNDYGGCDAWSSNRRK